MSHILDIAKDIAVELVAGTIGWYASQVVQAIKKLANYKGLIGGYTSDIDVVF